ncbi:MAG TPA: biotin/lipoyl-containing protein, partial [Paracoccaceae bacterium]|nr:biotin/lipoyl-containing protein [Paracoccaceae bacterium]
RQEPDFLAERAAAIGFPVLIKAAAGGGGKGMRRVDDAAGFAEALESARGEARSAFGDDRVLVEMFVARPRHIEVQVFGDGTRTLHLFERDCSLQRRHQKVIEEAPAPGMTPEMRAAMGGAAVRAAEAIGYAGAGTVEFITDASEGLRPDRFWFMEMNTRLQVEHPVTEAITGLDLVEWQLRVAAGEPLPARQEDLAIDGHAFEARIYAEDPAAGFLPATGRLAHLAFPADARIDTGVRAGDAITPHYDPMIAKLVVHGPDRATALARLCRALEATQVAGTVTNVAFLSALARHGGFAAGEFDTGVIDREAAAMTAAPEPSAEAWALAAIAALGLDEPPASGDPWAALTGWRLWGEARQTARLEREGVVEVPVTTLGPGRFAAATPAGEVELGVARNAAGLRIEAGGRRSDATVVRHGDGVTVFHGGQAHAFTVPDALALADEAHAGGDRVTAPMTGLVKSVAAVPGAQVTRGAALAVMEAMKMEHTLRAPRDGTVSQVLAAAGDQVAEGAVLVTLEAETETETADS